MSPIGYSAATLMQRIQENSAITLPQLHPGFVPHRSEPEETLQLIAYAWMTGIKLASTVIKGIKEGKGAMRKELLQDAILRYQRECGQLIKATNDARSKVM